MKKVYLPAEAVAKVTCTTPISKYNMHSVIL